MFEKPRRIDLEPLYDLAEFAWRNAPSLCTAPECADYHRVWSTIRLAELDGAVPAGEAFFSYGLSGLRNAVRPRVLISGGADTGLLALAATAFQNAAASPRYIFTDICETPVAQNRLFAEAAGLDAECIRENILSLKVEPVDAVLAHNFLGFFEPSTRPAVIGRWSALLKPGGVALIVNNVAPLFDQPLRPEHRAEMADRGRTIRENAPDFIATDADGEELERAIAGFPFARQRHLPPTEAQMRAMCDDAGMDMELIVFDAAKNTRGPSTRGARANRYVRTGFMARKRPGAGSAEG